MESVQLVENDLWTIHVPSGYPYFLQRQKDLYQTIYSVYTFDYLDCFPSPVHYCFCHSLWVRCCLCSYPTPLVPPSLAKGGFLSPSLPKPLICPSFSLYKVFHPPPTQSLHGPPQTLPLPFTPRLEVCRGVFLSSEILSDNSLCCSTFCLT